MFNNYFGYRLLRRRRDGVRTSKWSGTRRSSWPYSHTVSFDTLSRPVDPMTSQTLLKAMLLPLILAGASCSPDRPTTQLPSQASGQVQGKSAASLTGKIEIKALPGHGAWMSAPKDFKI